MLRPAMDGQGHRRQTGKHSEPGFLLIYTFQCKAKNIFIEDRAGGWLVCERDAGIYFYFNFKML